MSLFIGNISTSTTKKFFTNLFEQFGQCEVEFYRRFAYVNYTKDLDAEHALNAWNGKDLNGNKLKIEISHRKPAGYSSPSSEIDLNEEEPLQVPDSPDSSPKIEAGSALNPSFLSVPLTLPTKTPPNTPNEEIQENLDCVEEALIKSTEKERLLQEGIEEEAEVLQSEVNLEVEQRDLIEQEEGKDEADEVRMELKDFDERGLREENKELEDRVEQNIDNVECDLKEERAGTESIRGMDEKSIGKEGQREGEEEEGKSWIESKEKERSESKEESESLDMIEKEEDGERKDRNENIEIEERIQTFAMEEIVEAEVKGDEAFMEIDFIFDGNEEMELDQEIKVDLDEDDGENKNTIHEEILELPSIKSQTHEKIILPEPAILPNKSDFHNQNISPIQTIPKSDPIKSNESEVQIDLQSKETPSKSSQSPSKQEKLSPFDSMKVEPRLAPFNDPFVVQEPEPEKEKPSLLLEIAKKSSEKSKTSRTIINEETKVELSPIKRKIRMPRKVQKVKESLNEAGDSKKLSEDLNDSNEMSKILDKENNILSDKVRNKELSQEKEIEELNSEKEKSNQEGKVEPRRTRIGSRGRKNDEEVSKEIIVEESAKVKQDGKNPNEDLKEKISEVGNTNVDDLQSSQMSSSKFKIPLLKSLESLPTYSNQTIKSIRTPNTTLPPPPQFNDDPDPSNPVSKLPPSNSLKFKYEVLDSETLTTSQTMFKILKQLKDFSNSLVRCCNCGKEIKLKSVPVHLTSKFHKESS